MDCERERQGGHDESGTVAAPEFDAAKVPASCNSAAWSFAWTTLALHDRILAKSTVARYSWIEPVFSCKQQYFDGRGQGKRPCGVKGSFEAC